MSNSNLKINSHVKFQLENINTNTNSKLNCIKNDYVKFKLENKYSCEIQTLKYKYTFEIKLNDK